MASVVYLWIEGPPLFIRYGWLEIMGYPGIELGWWFYENVNNQGDLPAETFGCVINGLTYGVIFLIVGFLVSKIRNRTPKINPSVFKQRHMMKCGMIVLMAATATLMTGCCTGGVEWWGLDGYENIKYVVERPVLNIPVKVPRAGEYTLWKMPPKRYAGICVYKNGSDELLEKVDLSKGDKVGFRNAENRIEAYAGTETFQLAYGDYMWRLWMTEEDHKRIRHREFWMGFLELLGSGSFEVH